MTEEYNFEVYRDVEGMKEEIRKFAATINAAKIRISLPWQEPKFITAKVIRDNE